MILKYHMNKKYTLTDMYTNYLEEYPKDSPRYLTKKQFVTISKDLFETIVDDYIFEGYTYSIPKLNSYFRLEKFKPSKRLIDWKSTNEARVKFDDPEKIIYYKNFHTGGEVARFTWFKFGTKRQLKNKNLFKFKACRKLNRKLAQRIKTTNIISKIYN